MLLHEIIDEIEANLPLHVWSIQKTHEGIENPDGKPYVAIVGLSLWVANGGGYRMFANSPEAALNTAYVRALVALTGGNDE